jgi:hypothetical protein
MHSTAPKIHLTKACNSSKTKLPHDASALQKYFHADSSDGACQFGGFHNFTD